MSSNAAESIPADLHRFRLEHALQALEDALILLDTHPAEAIELSALERVRDDLDVLVRATAASEPPLSLGHAQAQRW
jgi:glutamyl-tRNA reductase